MKSKKHFSLDEREINSEDSIIFKGRDTFVLFDDGLKESFFDGKDIHIKERAEADALKRKRALLKFLCDDFQKNAMDISDEIYRDFFNYLPKPDIIFRKMKSRWGSCCKVKNLITLNKNLMFMPEDFLRYVIVHEFCHLEVFDHSKKFYALVEKIIPDYKNIINEGKKYTE